MVKNKLLFNFVPLNKSHHRPVFTCGIPALDTYIKKQASQDIRRNVCKVYVATSLNDPKTILGYYALSSGSVSFKKFPPGLKKKLPKYPIPVARIGRLAVDKKLQGCGLGKKLLMHALTMAVRAGNIIGINAAIVDAKDHKAKQLYEKYGFIAFQNLPLKLFIPIQTIIKSIP